MKNSRETRQKYLLGKKIKEQTKLFSAEELYSELKKEDDGLGIATVYRFLKDNSKKYHLHAYECNRRKIYSSKTNNHCHFKCERCRNIEHFNIKEISFLKDKLKGDICHFQIDVSGICEKCKSEKDKRHS